MQRRTGRVAAAVGVLVLGACVDPGPSLQETAQEAIATPPPSPPPEGGQCPEFGCGENSPVIDALGVYEFPLQVGLTSRQGVSLDARGGKPPIIKGGVTYELHVIDGRISGTKIGMPRLEGAALFGAYIPLMRGMQHYVLEIHGVRPMRYFLPPRDPVEAYVLEWRLVGDDRFRFNICNRVERLTEELRADPESGAERLMGMDVAEALVWEGDRYDVKAMTTDVSANDLFATIGCGGHTLSKLRLTHNTVHGQQFPGPFAWERRQATLKMLVADYCKNGHVFTVAGQKITWRGDAMSFFWVPERLEAWWSFRGAECLDKPRMEEPTTQLGLDLYPNRMAIWTDIATVCAPPPRCKDPDPFAITDFPRVSADPRL